MPFEDGPRAGQLRGSRVRPQPCQLSVERLQLPVRPFETLPLNPAWRHGAECDVDLLVQQATTHGELVEPVGEAEAFQLDGEIERLSLDTGEARHHVGCRAVRHCGLAEVPVGEDQHHLHGDDQHAERRTSTRCSGESRGRAGASTMTTRVCFRSWQVW
jgi:hypothetical protein